MTYTLAMALHPKIEIQKDGVAEVAMTDARAALTSLIREVSWGQRPGAFTERGKRVAMVVPTEFYAQALRDRAVIELLKERAEEGANNDHADVRIAAATVRGWLEDTEASVDV